MVALTDFTFAFEMATTSTPKTASPTYTALTSYVMAGESVTLQRGRGSEQDSTAQAGRANVTLRNTDGRFTMGNGSSPYAPLQLRRPCRWRVTYSATTYDLWQGFVDDWGNKREELTGVARLSMSDRIARAAKNQLAPAIVQEILSDAPFAYYPLNDSSDSFEAQDATGSGRPALQGYGKAVIGPTPGSFTLGIDGAPGPDSMTMAAFTTGSDPFADTGYLKASDSTYNVSGSGTTVEGFFYLPGNVRSGAAAIIGSWPGGTLYINDTMSLVATASDNTTVVTSTVKVPVGVMTHAAFRQSASGGTVSLALFLNGVSVATGSYAAASIVNTDAIARLGDGMDGRISNVAFHKTALTDARILDHANAVTSWSRETTVERFNRLCRVGGLATAQYATSGTTSKQMAAQPTDGKSLLDALTEVARVEGGSVYVNDAGVLTFACAATRYGTTVGVTLDATKAGQVDPDTEIPTDDADLINDSTATLPNGTRYRTVDATSVSAYDTHDETETLYTASDAVALNWTQWRVAQFKTPAPRLTEVPVNVVGYANSGGNVANLLNAEVGTKLQITNLPSDTAATSTLTLLIEGIRDEIRKDSWIRTFTTSPIGLNDSGWVLGTSALGLTANLLY